MHYFIACIHIQQVVLVQFEVIKLPSLAVHSKECCLKRVLHSEIVVVLISCVTSPHGCEFMAFSAITSHF